MNIFRRLMKQYEYIPALNADAAHIEMMVNLTAPYR